MVLKIIQKKSTPITLRSKKMKKQKYSKGGRCMTRTQNFPAKPQPSEDLLFKKIRGRNELCFKNQFFV